MVSKNNVNIQLNRIFLIIRFVDLGILIFAFLKLPYGYYIILRLVSAATMLFGIVLAVKKQNYYWMACFGLLFVIYNPILALHLGRTIWQIVNILTIIFLILSFFTFRRPYEKNYNHSEFTFSFGIS